LSSQKTALKRNIAPFIILRYSNNVKRGVFCGY
jgi:hypothetical protein